MRRHAEDDGARTPNGALTHAVAREACERVGASALIEGSVSAVGRATVVALVASDCMTGRHNRARSGRRRAQGGRPQGGRRHRVVDAPVARRVGRSLEQHNVPIEEATTPSLEALKAFTAGVEKRAAGSEIESIPFFERAIDLDRNFALAYTTLSSIYGGLGETGRSEDYARLAYEHRGTRQRARTAVHHLPVPRPRDRRSAQGPRSARSLEADVIHSTIGPATRSRCCSIGSASTIGQSPRRRTRCASIRRTLPLLEPRICLPRRRALSRTPSGPRMRAVAHGDRDDADSAPALSARGDGGDDQAERSGTWSGPRQAGRAVRRHRRPGAGRGVQRRDHRGAGAVRADDDEAGGTGWPRSPAATRPTGAHRRAVRLLAAIDVARRLPMDTTYEPAAARRERRSRRWRAAGCEKRIARTARFERRRTRCCTPPTCRSRRRRCRSPAGGTDAALAALRPAAPYERGTVAALLPIYFRAEAAVAGRVAEAAREFRAPHRQPRRRAVLVAVPMARSGWLVRSPRPEMRRAAAGPTTISCEILEECRCGDACSGTCARRSHCAAAVASYLSDERISEARRPYATRVLVRRASCRLGDHAGQVRL